MRARLLRWIGAAIGVAWAVLTFLASNSPGDVGDRAKGWASLPVVRLVPARVAAVASSPLVLSLTFLCLGLAVGHAVGARRRDARKPSATVRLGGEVSLAALELDGMSVLRLDPAVVSRINVVMTKLKRADFDVPKIGAGHDRDALSFYLHHVAAYLLEDDEPSARSAARRLVSPKDRQM